MLRGSTAVAVLGVLLGMGFAGCLDGPGSPEPGAPMTGLVATVHPLVSEAGAEMLRRGGNAVDAAAAVQWALNVVEPSMSGLGGGSLLLLWLADEQRLVFLDGREMAPAASSQDQFLLPNGQPQPFAVAHTRGYAVGVPGTLKVFDVAVREYGTLPLSDTFEPAIQIAEAGFPVDRYLSVYVSAAQEKLRSWPASAKLFLRNAVCPPDNVPLTVSGNAGCTGGTPLKEGDAFANPDLARTFRLLQSSSVDGFYKGPVATAIVQAQAARQGRMTAADLERYVAKEREPIMFGFQGDVVASAPPPSAGGLNIAEILGILEPLDPASKGHNTADALHWMIEAAHLAYQDRYAYIGDSDFVKVPFDGLRHPDYLAERRALIDGQRANANPRPGDPWKYEEPGSRPAIGERPDWEGDHTTHFTIVDGEGNVAAVTTTLENLFGTGMTVPGYGFMLNNELTDFDFRPGGPNQVEPGKRPRSSMTPTMVLRDGEPVLALGSPGGSTITMTVLQVLWNVLVHGQTLDEAVATPRIFSSDYPDVRWENGIAAPVREDLKSRGHSPAPDADRIGNVQAAQWSGSAWVGVADDRTGQGAVVYVSPGDVTRP